MASIESPMPARKSGLLINRNFGLLWVGQSISFIGDALLDFTLSLWIVFDIGRGQSWAPLAVGGVMLSSAIPALFIGPLAGVFVDRWDKRRTMLRAIAPQAILTALLLLAADLVPLPFFRGGHPPLAIQLIALYTVTFSVYACAQFTRPSRTALIGDLVTEPDRPQASGLIETMGSLSFMIGFGIAPLLFVPFGIGFALIVDVLSFVVAYVAILAVKAPPSARSVKEGTRGNVRREFLDGLRFSFTNLVIRTLLLTFVLVLFGSGAINALFVFFVSVNLHAPKTAIGLFPIVLGLGLVIGSILGGVLAKRVGLTRMLWIAVLLIGILAIVLSRQTMLIPGMLFGFLLGIPNGVLNVALMPIVLHVTPRDMVGRVMSVIEPAMTVAQIASIAVFGTLASTVLSNFHLSVWGATFGTYDTLVLIPGLLCLLAGAFAFVSLRKAPVILSGRAEVSD